MRLKKKITTLELAKMWCDLNTWKRPSKLKGVLPEDIRSAPNGMVTAIMRTIELAIGSKPINIQWEKHCNKMEKQP